jgi:hypothetical protein
VTEPEWHGGESVTAEIAEAIGSIGYLAQHGALAGVAAVIRERRRQVEAKGHTLEHDDGHTGGWLSDGAARERLSGLRYGRALQEQAAAVPPRAGPPGPEFEQEMLREAGALCAAKIDRLTRAAK